MGKNAHPPRGGASSKRAKPPPSNGEDTSFIVFSNDKDDKKKAKGSDDSGKATPTASSKSALKTGDQQAADDAPKRPSTRELIGGASWTGKLPLNILAEHCQKQHWEKPEYTMSKTPDGFSAMVILKSKNPKTQSLISLPPFKLPPAYKHLAMQPTAVEARHFAATYALFRVCSMRNIHMMMPPNYRDLWKGPFEELKKDDVSNGKGWMYEADPFLSQREREEAHAQIAKKIEMREKENAIKASQPGAIKGPHGAGSRDLMRGWKTAQKVEMGKRTRRSVEAIVKTHGVWNPYQTMLCQEHRLSILSDLAGLGFRKAHIEEAMEACKDKEEVLEWLLIHVPEDDLPSWSLPEGYVAGISMASGNLKREAAVKRLASSGYAAELCEQVYDECYGDEQKAAQILQDSLLEGSDWQTPESKAETPASNAGESSTNIWSEEQMVLASIYEAKYQRLGPDSCRVVLNVINVEQPVSLNITRPCGNYPQVVPIISINTVIPAYIRLSVIRQALVHASTHFRGEQMIFNLVDWIEREMASIVENPGRLSDVSSVSSVSASGPLQQSKLQSSKKRKRHPKPINWQSGSEVSLKMLSNWQARSTAAAQQKMTKVRQSLPAWRLQESIVSAVNTHQVVIISGETGSGKSTQSVQFILDDLIRRQLGEAANIICTQPRRISALGLADRVADERCSVVGQEIGYAIRGESKQTPGITKVTFVTTGVLLRRLQTSGGSTEDVGAALADISHVVVDEVHERTLDTDFLLALLRDVLRMRKDLKVILMSATLDAEVFANYFGGPRVCGRVEIQGRTFPVDDLYVDDVVRMTGYRHAQLEDSEEEDIASTLQSIGMGINYDLIKALVQEIDAELGTQEGGILIFLPGTMEISRMLNALQSISKLHALPLHASLLSSEQRRVFPPAPAGKRKVIAATNVAETSITIEDIVAVIDTGRVKETRYDPQNNMVKLEEVWVSRAAGKQRRGRAGRVRAGKCFKMYTRNAEAKMAERPEPEIRRVPLEQLCLSVKAMGVMDVPRFLADTLTPPESLAVEGALQLLERMGALEAEHLTALGRHMSMIPADLRCAKLMVNGALFGHLEPCVTIAAILTIKSPFVSPQNKRDESKAARSAFGQNQGDIIADLCAYDAWSDLRSSRPFREVRAWCDQNFLSSQTLNDISTTRSQYFSSLKEIGFLPVTYRAPSPAPEPSYPLLHSLLLSALHPQVLRIALPTQKYLPTSSGALAIDPESREIRFFDADNMRAFIHPSSTLFSAASFANNASFMSYFSKVATSKVFVRELSPCGAYGVLLFGGPIALDTQGRGLVVDGRWRLRGWARIGVLVGRLRGILEGILERWVEEPGVEKIGEVEKSVVAVVRRLVELDGMDR